MATVFKLDSTDFNNTLDQYMDLSRKELFNEVNRRAARICARAISLTPRAELNKIVQDMKAIETVKASYIKETKKRGQYVALSKGGKTTQGKRTVGYMGKAQSFAIANWRLKRGKALGYYQKFPASFAGPGRKRTGGTASQFYDRFVTTHRSSRGYIASGWLKAFKLFSSIAKGQVIPKGIEADVKRTIKFFPALKGTAGRGYGKPAQMAGDVFRAVFANAARGVEKIGRMPLRVAIRAEELDMKTYIEDRMQKIFNNIAR